MKFYVTIEPTNKLKKSFLNLKIFSIIDVELILEEHGYTYSTIDEYGSFIVSKYIEDLIKSYSKSKRIRGIIYSNPYLSEESLNNLFNNINENQNLTDIILFDDYNVPKLEDIYYMFDEIVYFPSIKKIKIIECINMPTK